jgi:hypothetical protein
MASGPASKITNLTWISAGRACVARCGMTSTRARDLKAVLDRLAGLAELDEEPTAEGQILRAEAIGGFIAGGPQLVDEAAPFIRDHYRRTAAEFTPEERAQYGDTGDPRLGGHLGARPIPASSPSGARAAGPLTPGRSYLSFEGTAPASLMFMPV